MAAIEEKDLCDWRQKELLALPVRHWEWPSTYDSLLILSTRKKHESGWACISVVGVRGRQPVEQAVVCADDLNWSMRFKDTDYARMRTDCLFPAGVMHIWGRQLEFTVGCALSSTDILVSDKAQPHEHRN